MELEIARILVRPRKRPVVGSKVEELANSIMEVGLLHPIMVRQVDGQYELVAGAHRIAALKQLGWETIPVELFDGMDMDAELAEIDENLIRAELTVLEQGELLLRREEILRDRGERARQGENRFTNRGDTVSPLTTLEMASHVGLSERATQRRMQIARNLAPDVKDALRETPVANSTTTLLNLARLAPAAQREVVKLPYIAYNSGDNEWYTPKDYIERAIAVMGSIDLDPASTEVANTIVRATCFYTKEDDGLTTDWAGRVWMNPPYAADLIGKFVEKLLVSPGVTEAIVLVNNATETKWFQSLAKRATAVCFPAGRVKFWHPEKASKASVPLQGQAVLYVGHNARAFVAHFSDLGTTWHM